MQYISILLSFFLMCITTSYPPSTKIEVFSFSDGHKVMSFEWITDNALVASYEDGSVRILSVESNTSRHLATYAPGKIILAPSFDGNFLAIGVSYTIDIFDISDAANFSQSNSIHIMHYLVNTISWNRENTELAISGDDALMAGNYGIVSVDIPVVEWQLPRGRDPVWNPKRDQYAVVMSSPIIGSNISIVQPYTKDIVLPCEQCRNLQWSSDGRWLGAVGVLGEQGSAFYVIDTENVTEGAKPILVGDGVSSWCGTEQIISVNGEQITLWNFEAGNVAFAETIPQADSTSVRCSRMGDRIALIDASGHIVIIH